MTTEPVVIADPRLAAEVRTALAVYLHSLSRAGARAPDLEQLARHLGALAAGHPPPAPRQARPWCSVAEAARLLGVAPRTVQRWAASGELPSRKVGGRRLIPADAIRRHPTTPDDTGGDTRPDLGHGHPNDQEPTP